MQSMSCQGELSNVQVLLGMKYYCGRFSFDVACMCYKILHQLQVGELMLHGEVINVEHSVYQYCVPGAR